MNELALFAGAGGGILGSILAGHRTVAAVEIEPYCREVLLRRQRDGVLPLFPIWDDIRTFDGRPWRGVVDIVSAGFPCQPFSTASRGRRVAPDFWDETVRVIDEVRPSFILLENVLASAYEGDPPLVSLCPSVLGSPHRRRRFWLAAHADDSRESDEPLDEEVARLRAPTRYSWWRSVPNGLLGVDDGLAYRMDRLRSIGNGQVPAVARLFL